MPNRTTKITETAVINTSLVWCKRFTMLAVGAAIIAMGVALKKDLRIMKGGRR